MRKSMAKCSVTLFALTLVWLILILAQVALPARAYSRQIPVGLEDGGDPDMPDQVMVVKDKFGGQVSADGIEALEPAEFSADRLNLRFESHVRLCVTRSQTERGMITLRFWLILSPLVHVF